jgi:hypothetical protein
MEKYMYINESFANVKKKQTKKQLHLKGTQYCSCYICCQQFYGIFKNSSGANTCKLEDEYFNEIMKSDIVFLSETHTCFNDPLSYDNYKCYINCKICLSKSLFCTNEEFDGEIYKKQINRSLSNPNKYTFNLNHIISVIDLSTNVIPVDICLLIKTASPFCPKHILVLVIRYHMIIINAT